MRRELSKECRKQFGALIKREFQEFREDKAQAVPHGWYVWTWQKSSNLFFHIVLVIASNADEFTTEAAWDYDGVMPNLSHFGDDVHALVEAPIHFRTDRLWTKKQFGHWWQLSARFEGADQDFFDEPPVEECLLLVEPAVRESIDKLKKHVIPLFEKVAKRVG